MGSNAFVWHMSYVITNVPTKLEAFYYIAHELPGESWDISTRQKDDAKLGFKAENPYVA